MEKVVISEKDFKAYVKVQMAGTTNMIDLDTVGALTGLSHKKLLLIMRSYSALDKKFSKKK